MANYSYPTSSDIETRDILDTYPECECDPLPWRSYLSSFEWWKEDRTLFISKEELLRIDIPARSVQALERREKPRVLVIQSHVTDKWYPFIQTETLSDCVVFRKVDSKCPIDLVLLEREQ